MPLLWFLLGLALGAAAATYVAQRRLGRARRRVFVANRRADNVERLAEIGTMTSGLAHEIKNPLSTLSLNAQLLAEEVADSSLPDDERHRLARRIETLRREADRLRTILTDFLQFAGQMRLDRRPHDLNVVVEELVDFFLPQAQNAGVRLRSSPSVNGPVVADVDAALLKQALLNLMLNATQALEQSPPGHPRELILRVERSGGRRREITLHVTDTGPGIDEQHLDQVFRPYFSTKRGGTGLGLPTARRIIEEHDGRLEIHSEPGRGSEFVIRLPEASTA